MFLSLLIGGCSKSEPYSPSDVPRTEDIFDDLDLGDSMDISPSEEDPKYHSNQDYDVGKD